VTPVYKLSASSITGRTNYGSMLAGNPVFVDIDFESIATVTVGGGGAASAEFTSIPATYTHLQIRGINQSNRATYSRDEFQMTVNSDTGANYSWHNLIGTGSAAGSGNGASASYILGQDCVGTGNGNWWGSFVLDILDYKNTNKYKTVRYIAGLDTNDAGVSGFNGAVSLGSGNWRNTNAITSIKFIPTSGTLWNQYSSFALYGIKGA
jgi:hypothetical protein